MDEFAGKTAVITGGASGIGFGMAERFAQERMNVVLADIEEKALETAVQRLEERQGQVHGVVTDTMRKASIETLLAEAVERFGNVHVLCNNAGVAAGNAKPVWEVSDADWQWVMGVNFWGVLYGVQAFVPHMLSHGEPSHIVNTASLAGLLPGGGAYGVSKHGVLALSEGLYRDLRTADANIGVSVLCPGFVDTNISNAERNRPEGFAAGAEPNREGIAAMQAMLATGKQPSEVADIVFDSIVREAFYILPHPAWDDFVRRRVERILERTIPVAIDPAEMAARRERGEVF